MIAMLQGIEVLWVAGGSPPAADEADALIDAGARVRVCGPQEVLIALSESPPHVVVVREDGAEVSAADVLRAIGDQEAARGTGRLVLARDPLAAVPALLELGALCVLEPAPAGAMLCSAVRAAALPAVEVKTLSWRVRLLEEELRARAAKQELLREQLVDLEHDLRITLDVVVGVASILRDGIAAGDPSPEARAQQIIDAVLETGQLLDRVRQVANHAVPDAPEAPAIELAARKHQRMLIDLDEVAVGGVAAFRGDAERRNISLQHVRAGVLHAWCDPVRVQQALANLLSNALKFTPKGGRVIVEVRTRVQARECATRGWAQLVVQDSGPGIPAGERERVFERGYRLARDQATPGSGLGLSVVSQVASWHRGYAEVEDSAEGARLALWLPLDLRARDPDGLLVLRDGEAADRLIDALQGEDPRHLIVVAPVRREAFLKHAMACRAAIIIPDDARAQMLDRILTHVRGVVAVSRTLLPRSARARPKDEVGGD